ncbi:MAG: flagellar biosynthesis/type III secretory pathway protein FliH [Rhodothermales bacterium]|jgi:flagellar biosynthesis/type III secretory pathway protein FliH
MSIIPAALLDGTSFPKRRTASRHILKSGNLSVDAESVMVTPLYGAAALTMGSPALPVSPAANSPAPSDSASQALAAAERNFERRLSSESSRADLGGYERGYEEGQAAAMLASNHQTALLGAVADGFDQAWESLAGNSEPLLVELAFRMAEAILESPLPESVRTLSTTALTKAVEKMAEARSVQVTVHPADFMMLDESAILVPLGRNHPNLTWRTDAALERGDWEARSDGAVIRRVAREMLTDLRDSLSKASDLGGL